MPSESGESSIPPNGPPLHKYIHKSADSIGELVRRLRAEDSEHYLYRGQNGLFGPRGDYSRQIPSVFRLATNAQEGALALEKSHLEVAWLFDQLRQNARLDRDDPAFDLNLGYCSLQAGDLERPMYPAVILGIAQHYGVATECIDLTNLEPAALFATQEWLTLRAARGLPHNSFARQEAKHDMGVLYRYDVTKLQALGVPLWDLSSGYAGSRPIVQEGRVAMIEQDYDRVLLDEGAYEVFPFHQSGPFSYSRPIQPSASFDADQRQFLQHAVVSRFAGRYGGDALPMTMRDLVLPWFFFARHRFNPDAWELRVGEAPDPYLALGHLCEDVLPTVKGFESVKDYAIALFGDCYGKSLINHETTQVSLRRYGAKEPTRLEVSRAGLESTAPSNHGRLSLSSAGEPKDGSPEPGGSTGRERASRKQLFRHFRDREEAPVLVPVPAGDFQMGTDNAPSKIYIDETPSEVRTIARPFMVGVFPVTIEQMARFAESTQFLGLAHIKFLRSLVKSHGRYPAIMTSWHDAHLYCEWLTDLTGHTYRLLTEEEWEYVCRAGTSTEYWWGDDYDGSRANSKQDQIQLLGMMPPRNFEEAKADLKYLTPVDQYKPNPWGVFDLSGNTWEWVEDVYRDSRTQPGSVIPPRAAADRPYRSNRGGSWMDPPLSLRSAVRSWAPPSARDRNISFRVARRPTDEEYANLAS